MTEKICLLCGATFNTIYDINTCSDCDKYPNKYPEDYYERTSGTLPKGFSTSETNVYKKIMLQPKTNAKILQQKNKCQGCYLHLDEAHVLLCHDCANKKLTERELDDVIKRFHQLGLYKKHRVMKFLSKIGLAKEVKK